MSQNIFDNSSTLFHEMAESMSTKIYVAIWHLEGTMSYHIQDQTCSYCKRTAIAAYVNKVRQSPCSNFDEITKFPWNLNCRRNFLFCRNWSLVPSIYWVLHISTVMANPIGNGCLRKINGHINGSIPLHEGSAMCIPIHTQLWKQKFCWNYSGIYHVS